MIGGDEMEGKELSERQKRFVDYFVQTGNAAKAARLAGYSEKSARETGKEQLQKPYVRKAVDEKLAELSNERTAKAQEILEYLTSVMRGEQTDEMAMNVGLGGGVTRVEKVRIAVGAKERLKAAEMLAKVHGLFITRQELEISGTVPVVIKDDI
ncbi:MAG: terminase small subunit [Selenomonadaceae bacterium]|nr:terminase small subunit [Selenomonadaceae bacterium]